MDALCRGCGESWERANGPPGPDRLCFGCTFDFRRWAKRMKRIGPVLVLPEGDWLLTDFENPAVSIAFDEWLELGRPGPA